MSSILLVNIFLSEEDCQHTRRNPSETVVRRVILCDVIDNTKAQLSDFKLGQKLFQFLRYDIFKIVKKKFKKV